jgi:hypothetical protein
MTTWRERELAKLKGEPAKKPKKPAQKDWREAELTKLKGRPGAATGPSKPPKKLDFRDTVSRGEPGFVDPVVREGQTGLLADIYETVLGAKVLGEEILQAIAPTHTGGPGAATPSRPLPPSRPSALPQIGRELLQSTREGTQKFLADPVGYTTESFKNAPLSTLGVASIPFGVAAGVGKVAGGRLGSRAARLAAKASELRASRPLLGGRAEGARLSAEAAQVERAATRSGKAGAAVKKAARAAEVIEKAGDVTDPLYLAAAGTAKLVRAGQAAGAAGKARQAVPAIKDPVRLAEGLSRYREGIRQAAPHIPPEQVDAQVRVVEQLAKTWERDGRGAAHTHPVLQQLTESGTAVPVGDTFSSALRQGAWEPRYTAEPDQIIRDLRKATADVLRRWYGITEDRAGELAESYVYAPLDRTGRLRPGRQYPFPDALAFEIGVQEGFQNPGNYAMGEGAPDTLLQPADSRATSTNILPRGLRELSELGIGVQGGVNLDVGGGRFDTGTRALQEQGIENLVWDPYWKSQEHNDSVLARVGAQGGADSATLLNVLNVIENPAERAQAVQRAYGALRPGGKLLVQVYEGNKSGVGGPTPKGWQENRGIGSYRTEVEAAAPGATVTRRGRYLVVEKPADAPVTLFQAAEVPGSTPLPTEAPDVTWRGREVKDWTPEDFEEFGNAHGVSGLGPLSELQPIPREDGVPQLIPGGLEGKFTYYDLLWLKANNLDPNTLSPETRAAVERKFARSTTPDPTDPLETFNRMVFGMLSPNNPLLPNEFSYSRFRARNLEDVQRLAAYADRPEAGAGKEARKALSDEIARDYGIQAKGKGGLGTASSADHVALAEMAKKWLKNPQWFAKRAGESWPDHVERVSSQLRGMSAKVGSFSMVWQDPGRAAISAIDRHMARAFLDELFPDPASRADWERKTIANWNRGVDRSRELYEQLRRGEVSQDELADTVKNSNLPPAGAEKVSDWEGFTSQAGSERFIADSVFPLLSSGKVQYRTAKGDINPRVPEHLKATDWVEEPEKVEVLSPTYRRALEYNQKLAEQQGLGLFASQWSLWDAIRGRLEPHEVMFPELYKLPKLSQAQSGAALTAHKELGYARAPGGVFPTDNPASLAYFQGNNPLVAPSGAKGSVTFTPEGEVVVRLFESADVSTLAHETGHILRRYLAPEDLTAAERAVGVVDGKWTVEAEEHFARAWERYLRTGRSPVPELARVFEQFKRWLTDIYQRISGSPLDVRVNRELRDLFDRLLGSEYEQTPHPKYAANVNLERIAGSAPHPQAAGEALRQQLLDTAGARAQEIATQRRGTMTHAETAELARQIGVDPSRMPPGTALNAEQLLALREQTLQAATEVKAAQRLVDDDPTPENLLALQASVKAYEAQHLALTGATAEAGRALSQFNIIARALTHQGAPVVVDVESLFRPTRRVLPTSKGYGAANKLVSRDSYALTKESLRARLSQSGPSETLTQGDTLFQAGDDALESLLGKAGLYHLEAGLRDYESWSRQMRAEFGAPVEPHLQRTWQGLRQVAEARAAELRRGAGTSLQEQALRKLRGQLGGPEAEAELLRGLRALPEDDPLAIARFVRQSAKHPLGEKIQHYFITNLLSGWMTQGRNAIGNALFGLAEPPTRALAGTLDALVPGERSLYASEGGRYAVGWFAGSREGLRKALYVLQHGLDLTDTSKLDLPTSYEPPGGLANPWNWPGRLLYAADTLFRTMAETGELHAQALRQVAREGLTGEAANARYQDLLLNPTDAMVESIAAEGHKRVFTGTDDILRGVNQLRNWRVPGTSVRPGGYVIPFVKAPWNITKAMLQHSPAGILNALVQMRTGNREAAMKALAETSVGTGLLLGAWSLAQQGLVTGDHPKDAAEREQFYAEGKQRYSVRIGDTWFDYRVLGPLAFPLVAAAALTDAWEEEGEEPTSERVGHAAATIGAAIADQSFFKGLRDLIEAIEDPMNAGAEYLANYARGMVPLSGALGNATNLTDPQLREAEGLYQKLRRGIPVASAALPARLDRWGEPVERRSSRGVAAVVPLGLSRESQDPIDRELGRLQAYPPTPGKRLTLNGKAVKLTRSQQREYLELLGPRLRQVAVQVLSRPGLPDESKRAMLEKHWDRERQKVLSVMKHRLAREQQKLPAMLGH